MTTTPVIVPEPQPTTCRVSLIGPDDFRDVPVLAWSVQAWAPEWIPEAKTRVLVWPMIARQDGRAGLVRLEYEHDLGAGYQQEDAVAVPWDDEAADAAAPYFAPDAVPGSAREQRYWHEHARAYRRAQLRHLAEVCGYRPEQAEEDTR